VTLSMKVPEQARWSEKALQAAIVLVEDVIAMAITCGHGADCPRSPHVWTSSAIAATCRIIHDVMHDLPAAAQVCRY